MTGALSAGVVTCVLLGAQPASAFCGFYIDDDGARLKNDFSSVVLMRDGTRTVLSMRNDYRGPPEDFAMVVPVPRPITREQVRVLPHDVFERLEQLTSPRLVEYWESEPICAADGMWGYGYGRGALGAAGGMVQVHARFEVGEYDVVVLGSEESSALERWLRDEGYRIPDGAAELLRPYVEAGNAFFVAKVSIDRVRVRNGRARLSPLRIHYDNERFELPIRLGLMNADGKQDLVVHIVARGQRYEVANRPNVFIPTNLEVHPGVRGRFGAMYAALFDRTLEHDPGAVVTEYAWSSSSCDPCPGPTLSMTDLATLGGDVVGGQGSTIVSGFTITRLRYRYGREDTDADLVFRAAPPVAGGTGTPDEHGVMDRTVRPASVNTFQARYAILNRWRGRLQCDGEIVHTGWGGPPRGDAPDTATTGDPSHARPGAVSLPWAIRVPVPELGLYPRGRPPGPTASRGHAPPFQPPDPTDLPEANVTALPDRALIRRDRTRPRPGA